MNTDHFKRTLEAELQVVEQELSELGWKNPETNEYETSGDTLDVATPMADSNEAADQLEELVEREGETATLQARRKDVVDALAKIKEGTFGTCETGGEAIEEDRLEANAAARTCKAHM